MRMEVDLLIRDKMTDAVREFKPSATDDGYDWKVRKAIFWPNGTLHSVYYLNYITGEWILKTEKGEIPTECIMGAELRKLLEPERKRDYSPKHPAAYGLQAAFDAEEAAGSEGSGYTPELRAAIVALLDSLDAHADVADDWEYDNDGETTRPWQQTSQFVALVDEVKRLMKEVEDEK